MLEGNLRYENHRLKTFDDVGWPHNFINPEKLAKTGFYYVGPFDQVKCYFCKLVVWRWEIGDDEVKDHIRWAPCCPLLRRRQTTNVPIEPVSDFDNLLPLYSIDEIDRPENGPNVEVRPGSYPETESTESSKVYERNMCRVCFSRPYNVAFMPCGHVRTCTNCAPKTTHCPECNREKERMLRVFFTNLSK